MPIKDSFRRMVEAIDQEGLEHDLAEVDRQIEVLSRRRQDILLALRIARSQAGTEPQIDTSMSRRDAVVFLLNGDPSRSWDADELIAELVRIGYLSADEDVSRSVRSQLSALHREKKIDRVERGRYRAGGP